MPTVLITGASRGIGLGLARIYAEADWRVIATVRNRSSASALAALPNVVVEELEVSNTAAVDALAKKYETTAIDLLISNAGVSESWGKDKLHLPSLDDFHKIFDTNVYGATKVATAFVPSLRLAPGSKVIGMSSILGSIGETATKELSPGSYFYRASKAALNAAYVTLAYALKEEGITAAVIHPGWVQTDMGGPKAPVKLEDSIAGIKRVLDGISIADTGCFLTFDGDRLPW